MTQQPEALRLADSLDNYAEPHNCNEDSANELRRLHAANCELVQSLKWAMDRIELKAPHQAAEGDAALYEIAFTRAAIVKHGSKS